MEIFIYGAAGLFGGIIGGVIVLLVVATVITFRLGTGR